MRISVKAKPGAKRESIQKAVQKQEDLFSNSGSKTKIAAAMSRFIVAVKEPPADGRANRAIERAVAGYFKVPPSRVRIVSGHASREKIIEIAD